MSKGKVLALFLLLILALTLITGCSQAEQGLLNEPNTYEALGNFILSLHEFSDPALKDTDNTSQDQKLSREVTVKYLGKIDTKNPTIDFAFTLVEPNNGTTREISRLLYQDNVLYIKIDQLIKLFQKISSAEISHKIKEVFGDTEYLSLTEDEYLQFLGESSIKPNNKANTLGKYRDMGSWELTGTGTIELMGNIFEYIINYLTDIGQGHYTITLTNAKGQIKKSTGFTVTTPTAKIMTCTEYLNKVSPTLKIQIDANTYTFAEAKGSTQGYLEVKNLENHTYLPLRNLAKIWGMEVGWDESEKQAYVLRNNNKINITGLNIAGRTYVKTRDLSKLGYQVSWDDTTRTVIINTTKLFLN